MARTESETTNNPAAYTIDDIVRDTGLKRTSVYKAIKIGALKVKKFGRRTLVTPEQRQAFIASLPEREVA
jgi:hypothetical protein